jgi:hypothetical protein
MVHVPPTTRLAATTAGDLRAASACAEVTQDRIVVALHERDARLDNVPPGQLIELSARAAALEVAASRVLRRMEPRVARSLPSIAQLSRETL